MLVSWLISCGLSSAAVAEIIRFGNEGSGPGKRENLRITPEQNPRRLPKSGFPARPQLGL
jgi:hypothetical protein